ncbi:hypothetical protein ACTXT7_015428 [Hymenolepis weldensis]
MPLFYLILRHRVVFQYCRQLSVYPENFMCYIRRRSWTYSKFGLEEYFKFLLSQRKEIRVIAKASLSKEKKGSFCKIEAIISPDVSNTFNATASLNSSKNSTQSPIVPPKVLRAAPSVKATNNDMNFHPSLRDCVKITNLMHSMKSSVIT